MFPSVHVVATVDLCKLFCGYLAHSFRIFQRIFLCPPSSVRSHFADSYTGEQGVWGQQRQQQSLPQVRYRYLAHENIELCRDLT